MYLTDPITYSSFSEKIFYNCTQPWFGEFCQYAFDESYMPLKDIVRYIFYRYRFDDHTESSNLTCYIHLPSCNRGLAPLCLDWREICNGKFDCIDSKIDEEYCSELEENECADDEYRCHTRGQCIPKVFLRDDPLNPDCLDRSDENLFLELYPNSCAADPEFRCEEHTCQPSMFMEFECGDGQCPYDYGHCRNRRAHLFQEALTGLRPNGINFTCWAAMVCVTRISDHYENISCNTYFTNLTITIRENCPSLFQFPSMPVLFGHIRFLYTNYQPELQKADEVIRPDYVCYNEESCPLSQVTSKHLHGLTCQSFDLLYGNQSFRSWWELVESLTASFYGCSTAGLELRQCENRNSTKWYRCTNSTKCISIHRLVDGLVDCYAKDDETYIDSCSLSDSKHRFKCFYEDKCLAPILLSYAEDACYNQSGIISSPTEEQLFSFTILCNGFTELSSQLIDNQQYNDETECDYWPCNNTYTRCDGYWNCLNATDEVNCPPSSCPYLEHLCVSPETYKLSCLPMSHVGDGIIDCIGGSDERQICAKYGSSWSKFACQDQNHSCQSRSVLCDGKKNCPDGDDERFCNLYEPSEIYGENYYPICEWVWDGNRTISEQFLCDITVNDKPKAVYFALRDTIPYPVTTTLLTTQSDNVKEDRVTLHPAARFSALHTDEASSIGRCNRGLPMTLWSGNGITEKPCLCPPSYYGSFCQYQNQRVSLTLQAKAAGEWRTVFIFLITLIESEEQRINSYEQINYLPSRDCSIKFNLYLLYSSKPKNISHDYFVHIQAFDKTSLEYRATWLFPLAFSFLPVHRMAVLLKIPMRGQLTKQLCSRNCGPHGKCHWYENKNLQFCKCDADWSGPDCTDKLQCNCSPDSECIGLTNDNRSICICPVGKFGPRCYVSQSSCSSKTCRNGGLCIPMDERIDRNNFTCVCPDGYFGKRCENLENQIDIFFSHEIIIPTSIFVHLITAFNDSEPKRMGMIKKIPINEVRVSFRTAISSHLAFAEFNHHFYLIVAQERHTSEAHIITHVTIDHQCLSIDKLFNDTIVNFHKLRRLKYYHIPCQNRLQLSCFYDDEYMCLCNLHRHANCFEFNRSMSYECEGPSNYCENGAHCFEDNPKCPTTTICSCAECFYGSRCQFSTKTMGLSIDAMLGPHIKLNTPFIHQTSIIKISMAISVIMFILGLCNSLLMIFTFQSKKTREVGCGNYLLASAIISLLTMIIFKLKFWLLVLSQMALITHRSVLTGSCISIDFLLQLLLTTGDWLSACIATERVFTVTKGVTFNKTKSKQMSKWIILCIVLFTVATNIQGPFHRHLVDDKEENRTWCIVQYSFFLETFNAVMIIFHFITPFCINLLSTLFIIVATARTRSITRKQFTYTQHLRDQLQQHKHLLISSLLLLILSCPRLVLSFLPGCMKSARNPWLFLTGYFVSFVPTILLFPIFVLPSDIYWKEFRNSMKHLRKKVFRQ